MSLLCLKAAFSVTTQIKPLFSLLPYGTSTGCTRLTSWSFLEETSRYRNVCSCGRRLVPDRRRQGEMARWPGAGMGGGPGA